MRQGDALSPSLFIIAAEVMSRGLNKLVVVGIITPFSTPQRCDNISHLAFADDLIIFTNGSQKSLLKLMGFLHAYEHESGHLINASKSCFVTFDKLTNAQSKTLLLLQALFGRICLLST